MLRPMTLTLAVITLILASLVSLAFFASSAFAALTPAVHPLFDGDAVHEIHLTFDQASWWSTLTNNFNHYDDVPYLEASFAWDDVNLASIGVRFKGNSSYSGYSGYKKSFKLDIDEFVDGQEIYGLDKLNLNNLFLDPSYVREKTAYELCAAMGVAHSRTNFAALYINGDYWGLYLLVEQQDKEFIESRWGAGEDGNLWKCTNDGNSTLEYLDSNESSYYNDYDLKTNETTNDWSDLVDFVDQLNNTSLSVLPDSLHNRLDVNSALAMLAIDNYIVNLDSYAGRCANYYFYDRDLDDRITFTKWDQNEAWGIFNQYNMSTTAMQQLSPYWTNPQWGQERPLAERLLQIDQYEEVYFGHYKKLMNGAAEPATLVARMEELRDMIRPYVYDDPNTMFSDNDFEVCMTSNVNAGGGGGPGGRSIPALQTFIVNRHSYLQGVVDAWTPVEGLVINELMAKNNNVVPDEHGDYDDWIEIANVSSGGIDLTGMILTDHWEGTADYVFPSVTLNPGEYVVVWADESPDQGDYHAPFKLDADGEEVFLIDEGVIIDQVTYPGLGTDVSYGRYPDGADAWQLLSLATPGTENLNPEEPETVVLYINEFLASNDTGLQDESGEYEDWLEIYNPGPEDVELAGLFLTDNLEETTQWAFPDMNLEAGGFLVVWCDNDETDGPLHTNFKLSGGGEEIGLFGRLTAGNEVIDSLEYDAQTTDISQGRTPDGAEVWDFFTEPTPGASNTGLSATPALVQARLQLLPNYPNPFNPQTLLRFELPASGMVMLDIYNLEGKLVRRLTNEVLDAGSHEILWDGNDNAGRAASSGVYLSRLAHGQEVKSHRMTLVR